MTTLPNPTFTAAQTLPRAPAAGLGPDAFTGIVSARDLALLANDTQLASDLSTAQVQIAALQQSNLPPGAYANPSPNAWFTPQYSGNASPWVGGTMAARLQFGTPNATTGSVSPANIVPVWAWPLSVGNVGAGLVNTFVVCWLTSTSNNPTFDFVVVSVDQSGNPTLGNILPVTLQSGSDGQPQGTVAGGTAVSATVLKIMLTSAFYNGVGTTIGDFIVNLTYDGASTLTAGTFSLGVPAGSVSNTALNSAAAYSVPSSLGTLAWPAGAQSTLFARRYGYTGSGPQLLDRSIQTANTNSNVGDFNVKTNYYVDYLGTLINATPTFVEAYTTTTTQDQNARLTVRCSVYSDYEQTATSTYRLSGYIVGSIRSVTAYSGGLFEVQFTDTGSNNRVALFALSSSGVITLIGGNYTGNNANILPLFTVLFSSLVKFNVSAGAALNQYLFSNTTYNPSASQPGVNDYGGTTNFSYTFGNITSAVQSTLRSVIRLTPNMVALVGYGGTSSVKTVISETVNLA